MKRITRVEALTAFLLASLTSLGCLAEEGDYLSGYAQGVLDARFSEFALETAPHDNPASVLVRSSHCPRDEIRQRVAASLTRTGRISEVVWQDRCGQPDASAVAAGKSDRSRWLPDSTLFRPLQADPREPRLAISYQEYSGENRDFNAADFHVGETFEFYRGELAGGLWQIGLTGGVFTAVDMDAKNKDLFNVDYLIGLPFTWRRDDWSTRLRYYHSSSHLTDEYIFNNGITFPDRLDISYDVIDLLVSHDWNQWRVYGGTGYIFRSTEELDEMLGQAGLEWRNFTWLDNLGLSFAADLQGQAELDWELQQSLQVALISRSGDREVHYFLEYFNGPSPNGQFFYDEVDYFGLGVRLGL